jgi:uncharacterized membrane protein
MSGTAKPRDDIDIENIPFSHILSHPATSPRLLAWVRARLAPLILIVLIAADFLLLGGLALQRHATFQTNALDLGYHDQAIWNTLHGRPFRFTTYQQDERASFAVDVPLAQIRDPHSLLSYHVEPLLLLIVPIFLIWDDARVLLVLQAAALALGAWPAYRLGRRRLGSPWAGIAIALLYLLAPARQATALSDFHTVAFTALLFLLALDALDAQRVRLFLGASLLCLLAREDTAIIVIALALYAALQPKFRRPALTLAGVSLLYLYLATNVVMPYFNGLSGPTYLYRYNQFGTNLREMAWNVFNEPQLYGDWLRQPDILAYLGGLLFSGGWVALAAPDILVIILPVALLNALANTGWPSSGGAHYSAAIVPFLIAAATYGIARLKKSGGWKVGRLESWKIVDRSSKVEDSRWRIKNHHHPLSTVHYPLSTIFYLLLLALVIALSFQFQQGVAPFSSRWSWPPLDAHARLGAQILDLIPPEAAVSAQSGLYPHLSHRERAYQFPTIADADYIVLDVTNNPVTLTYEGYFQHVRLALINPRFGPLAVGDGYLVLKRRAPKKSPLVDEFLTFTLARPGEIEHPLQADFGGQLRLEGYTLTTLPIVDQRGPHVQLTTFWRVRQTLPENLRPVFFYTRADGAIVYQQPEQPLELYWRPISAWQAGQLYKLTNPQLRVDALREVLLGVESTDGSPEEPAHRLEIKAMQAGVTPDTADQGTLLRLLELPK